MVNFLLEKNQQYLVFYRPVESDGQLKIGTMPMVSSNASRTLFEKTTWEKSD
jgi:hypothetical protein